MAKKFKVQNSEKFKSIKSNYLGSTSPYLVLSSTSTSILTKNNLPHKHLKFPNLSILLSNM